MSEVICLMNSLEKYLHLRLIKLIQGNSHYTFDAKTMAQSEEESFWHIDLLIFDIAVLSDLSFDESECATDIVNSTDDFIYASVV